MIFCRAETLYGLHGEGKVGLFTNRSVFHPPSSLPPHTSRGADVSPGTFSTQRMSNLIRFISATSESPASLDSNHF